MRATNLLTVDDQADPGGKQYGPWAVEVNSVSRRFGKVEALSNVNLHVQRGEFFSLLGPSGCGKTTLLRIIAGLDSPDSGSLAIGGRNAAEIPAHQRPVNTVFQSFALFPHMTVWENVAFGLRMKKVPPSEIETRVRKMMDLVGISTLANRRPGQISGGQKQRVALARAVVNEPDVLLLDEPLGALDLKLRKQLQVELRQLQRKLGITFIYVTHDQDEALVMSDRIAVMSQGKLEQVGPAREVYERPRTRFVAGFLGACNLITGTFHDLPGGVCARTSLGLLRFQSEREWKTGDPITLAIRPEKVRLSPADGNRENCMRARVVEKVYCGAETHYRLQAGDTVITAVVMNSHRNADAFSVEETIEIEMESAYLLAIEN